jgi:hypothetical protein
VPKRPFSPSEYRHGKIPAAPDVLVLVEAAVGRIFDEKLPPLIQKIHELEIQLATRRTLPLPLDPRKEFIAGIIKAHKPHPKISVSEIFREADSLQNQFPNKACYRPPPAWGVSFWFDMKGDNRAQAWVAKIRADPRYLPPEYLTRRGKERL